MILYYFKNTVTDRFVGIDSQSGGYPYFFDVGIPHFDTDKERMQKTLDRYKEMKLFDSHIQLLEVEV